jgi:glycine/D-amino acid oxidase-like deaminating enzyme
MGGGTELPGFPVPNPTVSYWQIPPHRIAEHRTTATLPGGTNPVDYAIVGSGVSGAAAAYKLLSRDASQTILLLEARTAASGASGRNGGHCRAGWWLNYRLYADALGEDEALRFLRFEEQNVADIAAFVREHAVDCDFRDVKTADAYVTSEEWGRVKEVVRALDEVCARRPEDAPRMVRSVLEGEEAREALGMETIVGAVTYTAHTQNPYLLVCRMLELALEMGLNLQTNTTVRKVSKAFSDAGAHGSGDCWVVETDRGNVYARQVILATNAYTNALHPGLAATGFLTPSRSQVAAIRPGSNIAGNPVLLRSVGLNDANVSGDYFMTREPGLRGEGDVLYGGGRSVSRTREQGITDDSVVHEGIASYLQHAPPDYFGRQTWGEEGEAVRDWVGITCYTPDTFPLVGEVPGEKGLWVSVGMNGHGMAMAFRCAESLVHMVTTGEEPVWLPTSFRAARAWSKEKVASIPPPIS